MNQAPQPHVELLAAMQAKGLKQKTLAKRLKMHPSTISQLLRGHWNAPAKLKKLSAEIERAPGPRITLHT